MENIEIRGQTYVGMDTVSIPKADGSGDAEFVLPEGPQLLLRKINSNCDLCDSIPFFSFPA